MQHQHTKVSNKQSENKITKQFLIITVPKRIKYLVVILIKEMRGSYAESDKYIEIKVDLSI